MTDKTEQTETHSTEEQVDNIEKMPSKEDFAALDTDVQKGVLEKFGASDEVEQDEQDSETPKEESDGKKIKPSDETNEGDTTDSEDETEDNQDIKPNKELQAEFTRRSQRLKKVESENNALRERLAKVEGLVEGRNNQDTDGVDRVLNPLKDLVKENPKLKPLLDAVQESLDIQIDGLKKQFKADKDALAKDKLTEVEEDNLDLFRENLNKFLNGPLKEMETALDAVIADRFSTVEEMEEAAKKDPELWDTIEGRLYKANAVKISELLANQQEDDNEQEAKKRNKEIQNTGVSGKSKTTTKTTDSMDIKNFNRLSTKEKRARLKKAGVVTDD